MYCKNVDLEHRTCTPQDGVKSRPCSLKTSLRLEERDERVVDLPIFHTQKGMQGTTSRLILSYDETREQGIMPCPTRPARHPGVPDTRS
jgi:hypothetical protein